MAKLTVFLVLMAGAVGAMATNEAPKYLLSGALLQHFGLTEVVVFVCRPNYRCEVNCSAGDGQESLARQDVARVEMSSNDDVMLVAAQFSDAVGKVHQSDAILPRPASCTMDNLVVEMVTPLVDGALVSPEKQGDVIFDMKPDGRGGD